MAGVILETHIRGINQFYKIGTEPVTVGRALDNDIILSDLSVSAHHLRIERDSQGGIIVTNLSDENGTRIGKEKLALHEGRKLTLPAEIWLGTSKIRLLASDMAVEPARVRQCNGFFCLLTSPFWAVSLLVAAIGLILFDQYLNTAVEKSIGQYLEGGFSSILFLLGFFLIIAGISRLVTHRWDIVPAISVASLLFVVPSIVDYVSHFLSYYFSNDHIRIFALNGVNFLLLPVLLTLFMIRVVHTRLLPAIAMSLLVSTPVIAFLEEDFLKEMMQSDFSPLPDYNKTLIPWDIRLEPTIDPDLFIQQAGDQLEESVTRDLDNAITE